eukprot:2587019-Alexandrium_andersonii.AAC.1
MDRAFPIRRAEQEERPRRLGALADRPRSRMTRFRALATPPRLHFFAGAVQGATPAQDGWHEAPERPNTEPTGPRA